MRILPRGNDEGSILLAVLVMIFLFSLLLVSLASRAGAYERHAARERDLAIQSLEKTNREIRRAHDLR